MRQPVVVSRFRLWFGWPAATVTLFLLYACATAKLPPPAPDQTLRGIASWYGEEYAGRTTANGEIFDPLQFTAAHRSLPFGTVVDVTNPKTSQTVRVRINDRGPYIGQRVIDLSYAAAQQIGLIEPGSGEVNIRIIKVGQGEREPPAPYAVKIEAPQERVVIASGEAPRVPFPLPEQNAGQADFRVEVEETGGGVPTRKRVGEDGKTIENVPLAEPVVIPAVPLPAEPPPRAMASRRVVVTPRTPRFIVQVGAFSVEGNARELQGQLTRIGQQSFIDHHDLYRVRIGPFTTREQAVKTRSLLEWKGLSAIIIAE